MKESCNNCNDSIEPSQSYIQWDTKQMKKVVICNCCWLDSKGRFINYPVKGLHYGDNS